MRDDVKQLLSLQETDLKIKSLQAELAKIPQLQESAKTRLTNDEQALAEAKKSYQENEVAIKNIELDIGTRRNTIERLKTQQFETKKNDEYAKLGEEILRYSKEVDDLETRELELMEIADQHRSAIESAKNSLSKTQSFVDEEITELQSRADQKRDTLSQEESLRGEKELVIDEDLLANYRRLFDKRNGDAVMLVSHERSCSSCHVQVTPATYASAQSGGEVAHCDNCGAILFTQ